MVGCVAAFASFAAGSSSCFWLSSRLSAFRRAAAAQATQGSINGVVTDTSNAVLPGVSVIATGPALQVPQLETVTNERGEYRLAPLPPGTYSLTFELPGFQSVKRHGVRIALGFTATIDQSLGVGTVPNRSPSPANPHWWT